MRQLFLKLRQPVFADQVIYSMISAATVVTLAAFMPTSQFSLFALIQAGTMYAISLQRATVGEPSLSLRTRNELVNPFGRYLVMMSAVAAAVAGVLFVSEVDWWVCSLAAVPLIQDALRYRAFLFGRTGVVLWSDGIWLAGTGVALLVVRPDELSTAFMVWCLPCAASCLPLLLLRSPSTSRPAFRSVFALGRYGLGDLGLAICTGFLPLLVVDALLKESPVGAYRLAQTAFGPLNLIAGTMILTQLLNSEALRAMPREALQAKWRDHTKKMVVVGVLYSVVAMTAVAVVSQSYSVDIRMQLLYALPVTVLGTVLAVRANASIAIIRALGEFRIALRVRMRIAASAASAMIIGVVFWRFTGLDPLVFPVLLTGLATSFLWARSCERVLAARPE